MPTESMKSCDEEKRKVQVKVKVKTAGAPAKRKNGTARPKTARGGTKGNKSKLVEKAIATFEKKLDADDVKATVGDLIRLLQLQKELEGEDVQEIKVTWVEASDTESS